MMNSSVFSLPRTCVWYVQQKRRIPTAASITCDALPISGLPPQSWPIRHQLRPGTSPPCHRHSFRSSSFASLFLPHLSASISVNLLADRSCHSSPRSTSKFSPNFFLINASLRDKYGLTNALRAIVLEAIRRQNVRRQQSLFYGGAEPQISKPTLKSGVMSVEDPEKQLDAWMESFTAVNAPAEVKRMILDEGFVAVANLS